MQLNWKVLSSWAKFVSVREFKCADIIFEDSASHLGFRCVRMKRKTKLLLPDHQNGHTAWRRPCKPHNALRCGLWKEIQCKGLVMVFKGAAMGHNKFLVLLSGPFVPAYSWWWTFDEAACWCNKERGQRTKSVIVTGEILFRVPTSDHHGEHMENVTVQPTDEDVGVFYVWIVASGEFLLGNGHKSSVVYYLMIGPMP